MPDQRPPAWTWQNLRRYASRYAGRPDTVTVPADADAGRDRAQQLASLLCAVGVELLRAGTSTEDVTVALSGIAARHGMRARSFVVPRGLFVRVGTGPEGLGGELDFAPVDGGDLRLDQVQALKRLVDRMLAEPVPFDEVREALRRERAMPQRFSPATSLLGYTLLTVGLGVMLHATVNAVAGYAVLGFLVGVMRVLTARYLPQAASLLPVTAAIVVTTLSLRFAGPVLHETAANLFIPPLIAFLPGAALTMGAIELARGDALAGLSRLAGAANVLLLLGLGILVGTDTVHAHPSIHPAPEQLGAWVGWLGVLALSAGFTLHYSAPAQTFTWLTGALLAERLVQTAGGALGGAALGAFCAGALLPPMAAWVQRRTAIPDQVVFLPCFWMLVPGSKGLSGVTDLLVNRTAGSLNELISTLVTVVSIALGVLVGAALQRRTRIEVGPVAPT